jgi:APA family basic amino acid/polyamine antiporter
LGSDAFIVLSVIALFATSNTVLMMLLASSRITYGMAESFSLPSVLAQVHASRRTPWVAIVTMMALSMIFVLAGDIEFAANVTNFTLFVTFIVVNAALVMLRYKAPDLERPFKVPLAIGKLPLLPLLGLAFCIFMLAQLSGQVLAVGVILTVVGWLFSMLNMKR